MNRFRLAHFSHLATITSEDLTHIIVGQIRLAHFSHLALAVTTLIYFIYE